jgi:hypothetical protein
MFYFWVSVSKEGFLTAPKIITLFRVPMIKFQTITVPTRLAPYYLPVHYQ